MAIVIDDTVGGAAANSYGSLAAATAFFETVLGASAWDNADDEIRKKAMVTAAKRIDAEVYRGTRVSADQARQFPRTGLYFGGQPLDPSAIPGPVFDAWAYETLAVLEAAGASGTTNPNAATGLEPFKSLEVVGAVKLEMRESSPDDASQSLSPNAYRLLRPYILTGTETRPAVRPFRITR